MDLIKLIEQTAGVSAYKVVDDHSTTSELFFVGRKLETVRATDTLSTSVTVFVDHDEALGDSTFPVFPSMDEAAVKGALEQAVERARLVANRPYSLPQGGVEEYDIPSDFADLDPKEVAERVAQAVFEVPLEAGGSINALEIFVTTQRKRVRTSTGVDKTQTSHRLAVEAIPTQTDEAESVELYEWFEMTDLDLDAIKREIADKMREVKARKQAVKGEPQVVDVVLRAPEIEELAEELMYELTYAAVFSHSNAFALGDHLQKDLTGDPFTLIGRKAVKGSRYSAAFDSDGTTLRDQVIVQNGVAKALWGSSRYGQYLGVEPAAITGSLGCMEVGLGTLKEVDNCLELVSMSGLQLDVYNDYIGGEIRLGYLHQGGKVTPVTGISMSAKLSDAPSSIRLSSTPTTKGAYYGPDRALLKDVQIV